MIKLLIAGGLLLLLAACSTTPPQPTAPVTDWQGFAQRQQQLDHWRIVGKLGLQSPQQKSGSVNVVWQQQQHQYHVLLKRVGIATTHINGDPQQVVMRRGKQQHTATNSEQLTRELLGIPLSVESLTYWVRGIPAPDKPITARSHDSNGALQTLSQNGWQLEFSRYTEAGDWLLPHMIKGQRGELSFKLHIKKWQPEI